MILEKLKVLIVDDSIHDAQHTHDLIRASKISTDSVEICYSVSEFYEIVKKPFSNHNLFLFDYSLPDGDGIEMVQFAKKHKPESTSIIITGNECEEIANQALNSGAQDYIYKQDINVKNLERVMRHSIERQKLVHQLISSEKALNSANSKLSRLSEAKTNFLSYFSHEVRTPLALISGITDLLASTELDSRQQKYIKSFQTASAHLMELINDVLDISKIELGGYKTNNTEFLLSDLIEDILSVAKPACEQKGLKFIVTADMERSAVINSDIRAIRHVLFNLINNAIKFCNEGSIELKICRDSVNPLKIFFSLEDTGPGINEENLQDIFEVFGTSSSKSYGKAKSSGIGLSLAKQIVSQLGGEITASSKALRGSVFSFYISSDEVDLKAIKRTKNSSEEAINYSKIQTFRVLMVEDDRECRNLVKTYFKNSQLRIDYAIDGFEAISMIQSNNYDLIITDLNIPVLNGEMVLKKARSWQQESKLSKTPIYALSGNVFKSDVNRASQIGFDGFISKPFNKKNLYDVIENFETFLEKGEFYNSVSDFK